MKQRKDYIFNILATMLSMVCMQCATTQVRAQSDAIDANVNVVFQTAGQKEYRTVQYAVFKTENKARSVMATLKDAIERQRGDRGNIELDAWDKAVSQEKVRFRTSPGNGSFRVHAYPDMALLICTYLPDDELTIEDARFEVITLKEGQTVYDQTIQLDMGKSLHTIGNVDVFGTNRDTISITAAPALDDGKRMYFRIHVELPEGYGNEKGRLVVQPMAVDCQTEDTVDYVQGLVMEGPEYHKLQNKRMLYNYAKHDPVAPSYVDRPMYSDEKVYLDTTLVYVKPDPSRTYKIPYTVAIADLNHEYFRRSASTGSCNSKNIFKFLDLGVAAADMDLDEFRTDAESNYETKNQDLRLKFVVGRSELTADSLNMEQLDDLTEELRSYGDQLMEVKVEATASPEGGLDHNTRLAAERTRVAAARVRGLLGKVDVAFHTAQPRVYSWLDVADELEKDGNETLADSLRQLTRGKGFAGEDAIRRLPAYETAVVPVLERLRMMRVTYRYEREHVMNEAEVTREYYRRKQGLLQGWAKDFSDGDYYNLFHTIRDSLEQDTLTMLAYKHITRHGGYEQIKFSMYVANRMAMLNQRLGKPDASVLRPFINERLRAVQTREMSERSQKNRRELLINQILTYFQLEQRDSALSYCNYWFANDADPKVERMMRYITFKEGFVKYATHQLSPADEEKVVDAMNYVISCAPDNKAVLYTEAREILNVPHQEARRLVDALDDSNAKKWYLRGMLEADLEEKKLDSTVPKDYVPNYLAYFHRSFELEPSFKWLYFYDGQISDRLRDRYKYRKRDIPRYRAMFAQSHSDSASKASTADDVIEISGE